MIGLVVGALLGGGAVAVVSAVVHRGDHVRIYPDFRRHGPPYPYYQYPPPYVIPTPHTAVPT
ncbi:MAG: hypothetical protein HOY71_01400, partial [Nonomuraea sp.]|nr:hypothetical protein [Nonomuraea sp.]